MPNEDNSNGGEAPEVKKNVPRITKDDVIGHTVSADQFKHFQQTEADSSDMEGQMMVRQQISKGEGLSGRDPMKWAGAIAVLLIIAAVAYIILTSAGGGGGGGGGISLPGIGTIP